jgi:hypothetical protein
MGRNLALPQSHVNYSLHLMWYIEIDNNIPLRLTAANCRSGLSQAAQTEDQTLGSIE